MKKPIDISANRDIIQKLSDRDSGETKYGGIAQLGAQANQKHTPLLNLIFYLMNYSLLFGGIAQLGAQANQKHTPLL
ncbi:MAG: hypothetical protein ACI3V0_08985, partial [Faecousia sp.]